MASQPVIKQSFDHDLDQPDQDKMRKQIELERLFNKNQLLSRIRKEFTDCKDFNFTEYIRARAIPIEFGLDVLVQMALHKRATLPTLVGIMRPYFGDAQVTADMLYKCAVADLMDWDPKSEQFIVRFEISDDVQEELDLFQFPLPMVVRPRRVTNNKQSGYVLGGGSLILRHNHHDDDICLDHINRANGIRFVIDHKTARMVKNQWRNLDKPKPGETKEDFNRRKKAFDKYDRNTKAVMDILGESSEDFYLTHKYDKRGRTYCQGYHITYQGSPWNKAVIQLVDKEIVDS